MLVTQSCLTLCDPKDGSPPGSCVHEIFPARILEWVATSFCRGSSQPRDRTRVSCPARRFFTNRRSIVHGILQARILEWVAFPFSRGSSQPRDQTQVSLIAGGFFTSGATREAQEYWSGFLIPSPVDLPNPGIEQGSPTLQIFYQLSQPGRPKNAGAGSLSLLQWIFPTQESNQGLLHCLWLLYQLSYEGSSLMLYENKFKTNPLNPVTGFLYFTILLLDGK